MDTFHLTILITSILASLFMAFSNGANDIANAFASAVGSRALSVKQALFIGAFLNLLGAILLGAGVAKTLINGVIHPDVHFTTDQYILGMLSSLIASAIFVLLSTFTGMPVSSTHAIVGSLAGVGIILHGLSAINWKIFSLIALSWIASPFLAGLLSWSSIKFLKKFIFSPNPHKSMRRLKNKVPFFFAITIGLLSCSSLKNIFPHLNLSLLSSSLICLSLSLITYFSIRFLLSSWIHKSLPSPEAAESIFKKLQISTACYVAFAHGSNDVSNSISPTLAIYFTLSTFAIPSPDNPISIPIWALSLGGFGMALGIILLGHRVIATMGEKLTLITNSKGFCVDFSSATTVVLASILGLPISSTHAATGSIVGVGLEKGLKNINLSLLGKILIAWFVTVPLAALITSLTYLALKLIFF